MNNTAISRLLLPLLLLTLASALDETYSITKHYVEDRTGATTIGLGKISIFEEGEVNQAYIEPLFPSFITTEDLARSKAVILTFTNNKDGSIFSTAVSEVTAAPHSEKISVLISAEDDVIGFNYVQTRQPNKDIEVDFVGPERGVEHIFKMEPAIKPQAQEESFFQKYKWPLIIGAVILYLSMSVDPEKQGQAGGAPARQA